MPLSKFKDPFHKIKEKLSKYLDHSTPATATNLPSTPVIVMMKSKSSFLGLGRGKSSEPPRTSPSESTSPSCFAESSDMFPKELQPDLVLFNNIFAHLHMGCWSCHAPLPFDLDGHIEAWLLGTQVIPPTSQISALQCVKCQEMTCVGCGKLPKLNNHHFFTTLGVVNHCCYEGRLFGVWVLLARFDKAQAPENKKASTPLQSKPSVKKPKSKKPAAAVQTGVGYNSGSAGYPGSFYDLDDEYDDFPLEEMGEIPSNMPIPYIYGNQAIAPTYAYQEQKHKARDEKTKALDNQFIETLKLLVTFLPVTGSPFGPLEEIRLYRLSFLFDKIAGLLRNDSVIDITHRKGLYTEVFKFVQAVANVPELIGLLLDERVDKSQCPGLQSVPRLDNQRGGFSFHSVTRNIPGTYLASVFSGSHDTYRQAKSFLAISQMPQTACAEPGPPSVSFTSNNITSFAPDDKRDTEDTVKMCERIVAIYESLERHEARPAQAVEDQTDNWTKYAEENRVTFDDDVLTKHRYLAEINNLKYSHAKNRLATIGKEVATLTTSLPPGIFVKVAESRSDAMKVLIVGPEGTPYSHGLFIFDLFLDASYPVTPPKVAFVLHGNDSEAHSFNPNLHRGGTVCLSLLNTWEGNPDEMWQPNKSTILSVLVSIQAMILGSAVPWVNEPGFAGQENSVQAREHRLLIQTKTVRYAMIGWLENQFNDTKSRENIWKEICQTYWKHNGTAAFETVKEWVVGNPALTTFGASPTKKRKGKNKEVQTDAVSVSGGQDLVERLAQCLGVTNDSSNKRKLSSASTSKDSKKHKSESSDQDIVETRWHYTGAKTTKEVRAACKEFGLGSGPTIQSCVAKLETHVNSKGKASEELVEKWGEMRNVAVRFHEGDA